eukprot:Skav204251  [mRNA]  locus=scaffold912:68876:78815:- [translate_table: standard]
MSATARRLSQSAAEAADLEEIFCLSWERWSEERVAAVAPRQVWPLPPAAPSAARPALLRLAEAAMTALAAVWSCDVECKRLTQQVDELQRMKGRCRESSKGGASLSKELRKTKQQLQQSELQKRKLLSSLQEAQIAQLPGDVTIHGIANKNAI